MAHTEPSTTESTLVLLTRVEGKLDRVIDKVVDLRTSVDQHRIDIDELKSLTQTLKEGAAASKETAIALALALKDAKVVTEETTRADAAKSERRWTPFARGLAIAGVLFTLLGGTLTAVVIKALGG